MIKVYNTISRKKEILKPLKKGQIGIYTCGPTVYWFAHIGNLRSYIFEDLLKRVLEYNDYKVKHVMNITDVGHLTSDADAGEDKMEKGAKREGKTAWEIAEFYTKAFQNDLERLNIKQPDIWIKATDTIKEQIELIKLLEKKGFTYKIADGIYFDSSKLKTYGKLWPKKMKIKSGARVEMVKGKKNPTDFALWKFTPAGVKRQMEWESPWGVGFPGWHTECVVMSAEKLGVPFDIHCGGIDHILIHHTNEIAQAEAAFEKNLANYWMPGEFLTLESGKMAKSDGNILTVQTLIDKGLNPLAYRYLCLTTHYRSKLSFSWTAMEGSQNALNNLYKIILNLKKQKSKKQLNARILKEYQNKFLEFINNDLDIPKALALLWKAIKEKKINNKTKLEVAFDFDKVFGLNLGKIKVETIPTEIKEMANERKKYRQQKEWQKADEIRQKIESLGYFVEDTAEGPKIKIKINN